MITLPIPIPLILFSLDRKRRKRKRNRKKKKLFWSFWLRFRQASDSASDPDLWFTLDRNAPCASDSDSASDSVASVNQPKDAQKQLARTSLIQICNQLKELYVITDQVRLSHWMYPLVQEHWNIIYVLLFSLLLWMPLEDRVFCKMLFIENEAQINKNNCSERCFSCQNKSVCQTFAPPYKKWKSAQKAIYMPFFARKPSAILFNENCVV